MNLLSIEMYSQLKTFAMTVLAACLLGFSTLALAKDASVDMNAPAVVVNVNEADAATIANTLVGIGISRAQAIVDYREKHGQFYSAEELTAVKGIGQSTIEKNLARISLQ